jgi:hypothetical protein
MMANGRNRLSRNRSTKLRRYVAAVEFRSNIVENMRGYEKKIIEPALRSAAFAGINVLYLGMRQIVPLAEGTLHDSIYQYHDKQKSSHLRQVYATGPNKVKAPHWYNVEFGHWRYNKRGADGMWMRSKADPNARGPGAHTLPGALETPVWVPAVPYIRPTWDSLKSVAGQKAVERMRERVKELIAK